MTPNSLKPVIREKILKEDIYTRKKDKIVFNPECYINKKKKVEKSEVDGKLTAFR